MGGRRGPRRPLLKHHNGYSCGAWYRKKDKDEAKAVVIELLDVLSSLRVVASDAHISFCGCVANAAFLKVPDEIALEAGSRGAALLLAPVQAFGFLALQAPAAAAKKFQRQPWQRRGGYYFLHVQC